MERIFLRKVVHPRKIDKHGRLGWSAMESRDHYPLKNNTAVAIGAAKHQNIAINRRHDVIASVCS